VMLFITSFWNSRGFLSVLISRQLNSTRRYKMKSQVFSQMFHSIPFVLKRTRDELRGGGGLHLLPR
jgi:ABC-type molybdate transport system permease subunit